MFRQRNQILFVINGVAYYAILVMILLSCKIPGKLFLGPGKSWNFVVFRPGGNFQKTGVKLLCEPWCHLLSMWSCALHATRWYQKLDLSTTTTAAALESVLLYCRMVNTYWKVFAFWKDSFCEHFNPYECWMTNLFLSVPACSVGLPTAVYSGNTGCE